jgi:hypothetical protein
LIPEPPWFDMVLRRHNVHKYQTRLIPSACRRERLEMTAICALPSRMVSGANARFLANAAQARRLGFGFRVQGGRCARQDRKPCAGGLARKCERLDNRLPLECDRAYVAAQDHRRLARKRRRGRWFGRMSVARCGSRAGGRAVRDVGRWVLILPQASSASYAVRSTALARVKERAA